MQRLGPSIPRLSQRRDASICLADLCPWRHVGAAAGTFIGPLIDAAVYHDWGKFPFEVNAKNLFDNEYVAACFDFG
jgi:hypothetical protein